MTTRAELLVRDCMSLTLAMLEELRPETDAAIVEFAQSPHAQAVVMKLRARAAEIFGKCAASSSVDEPIFTLRAQDKAAPDTVFMWASFARRRGSKLAKTNAALEIQARMLEWQQKNEQRVKAAD